MSNPLAIYCADQILPDSPSSVYAKNMEKIHNVELSLGEVSTILYYIESYFQGSDERPEDDDDVMSIFRKFENLSSCD